jgi:hypothetical protein
MAITTLTEVKALNQISGSTYDTTITALIPLVSDFIVTYCRMTENDIEKNSGLRIAAAQMIKHQLSKPASAVSAESIGDYSVSYTSDYPDYIMRILDTYKQTNYVSDAYYSSYDEALKFNQIGVGYKDTYNIK